MVRLKPAFPLEQPSTRPLFHRNVARSLVLSLAPLLSLSSTHQSLYGYECMCVCDADSSGCATPWRRNVVEAAAPMTTCASRESTSKLFHLFRDAAAAAAVADAGSAPAAAMHHIIIQRSLYAYICMYTCVYYKIFAIHCFFE
ncbi:uncharacterized protein LOC112905380 [Agrilus planipennis]|uniref:Uncharacterized protein LOC112905380 n=1 Tax=Agrilus planipennis TaxID=224129 RepID=A0A7F5RBT8_AGRPL|nr:uncharacterized protein LOC112905380 [Agrilus planipennis]